MGRKEFFGDTNRILVMSWFLA